jgi:aerobic C4-dicarboxylate transport protein
MKSSRRVKALVTPTAATSPEGAIMATTPASNGVLDRDPIGNQEPSPKKDRTHWLYIMVIVAVVAGAAIGLVAPELGKALKPLGTGFVALIKMIIAPVNAVVAP